MISASWCSLQSLFLFNQRAAFVSLAGVAVPLSPRLFHRSFPSQPRLPQKLSPNFTTAANTTVAAAMSIPSIQEEVLPPPIPGSFQGRGDAYGGFIIDATALPDSVDEFITFLASSLPEWHHAALRGIWLKLPIEKAHFIGHAVDSGFVFHHAEPEYVMLTQWLPEKDENKLPPNASHQVGVGAFVYDKQSNKVLVVQEKNGPLKGKGVWKLPTGLVNTGEDVTEAACREVEEETGIKARFKSVLVMRQAHGLAFGKSDMFFVIALEPTMPAADQTLSPQEEEIEAAAWISLEEYTAVPFFQERPLLKKMMETCAAWARGEYTGLGGYKMRSGFTEREDLLMFGETVEKGGSESKKDNEDAWIGLG